MKLNLLLNSVLTKIGADASVIKSVNDNVSLAAVEVEDAIAEKMNVDYFTEESAKQNPAIRSKIKAEVLNGLDAQTAELLDKYEFDDEAKGLINAEKSTSKKYSKLIEKVAEKEKAKAAATGTGTKDTLTKEIEKLNAQILSEKKNWESKVSDIEKARKDDKVNFAIDSIYSALEYSLPGADKSVSIIAAKAIMGKIASDKGVSFDLSDAGIKLMTKEGTDYFENNAAVSPADFIKKHLLENKLLKISEGAPAGTPKTNTTHNGVSTPSSNGLMSKKDFAKSVQVQS